MQIQEVLHRIEFYKRRRWLVGPMAILIPLLIVGMMRDSHQPIAIGATTIDLNLVVAFPELAFDTPLDITHAGDDRLFVVERAGEIYVIEAHGELYTKSLFLNIRDRVDTTHEGGLFNLTFSPNYADDGYFYLNYTTGPSLTHSHISRFRVDPANPNLADPASELVLLQVAQPQDNHNGGDMAFGPDGYLYIPLGDGGVHSTSPDNPAQQLDQLLGKILRIDVNPALDAAPDCDPNGHYAIPATNPFVDGHGGNCDEIWAYGLRNPWRFAIDSESDHLFIGDVGLGTWEEIDFQAASSIGGENYGWPVKEGNLCLSAPENCDALEDVAPIFEYQHGGNPFRCSITGGLVYRGSQSSNLLGHYLYGDYCSGEVWSLSENGLGGWENRRLLTGAGSIATFGEDAQGELYLSASGIIYKIVDNSPQVTPTPSPMPTAMPTATPIVISAPSTSNELFLPFVKR